MSETIRVGPCKCGGYGQCFDKETEQKIGVCHRGIGMDIFGHFVTAKLKGQDDCRQGVVVSTDPLIIRGKFGEYECEGKPTIVTNPPSCEGKAMDKLNPCPFCGSKNIKKGRGEVGHCLWMYCSDCRAEGPLTTYDHDEAAAAWNTRAPDYSTIAAASLKLVKAARVYANRMPKNATRREEETERLGKALAAVERIIGAES